MMRYFLSIILLSCFIVSTACAQEKNKLRIKRTTHIGYVTEYFSDKNGVQGGEIETKLIFSTRKRTNKGTPSGVFINSSNVLLIGKDYKIAQLGVGIGYQKHFIKALPRLSFELSALGYYYIGLVYEEVFEGKEIVFGGSVGLSYSIRKKFGTYIKVILPGIGTKLIKDKNYTYPNLISAGIQF